MTFEFAVEVGCAIARPPSPANIRLAWVRVIASSESEAHLLAAWLVGALPVCVMVTHTQTLEVAEC
jgi:hypothetical protein